MGHGEVNWYDFADATASRDCVLDKLILQDPSCVVQDQGIMSANEVVKRNLEIWIENGSFPHGSAESEQSALMVLRMLHEKGIRAELRDPNSQRTLVYDPLTEKLRDWAE